MVCGSIHGGILTSRRRAEAATTGMAARWAAPNSQFEGIEMGATKPPDSRELEFIIPAAPVSQQSKRSEKDKFAALIRQQMGACAYLLSGDVSVDIEWLVHEQRRYESDAAPDVDNILKPLLDTLCGPDGVLIDDCQVQAVSCRWIDWTNWSEQVQIRVRFQSDDWLPKAGFFFVHLGQGLCFPLNRDLCPNALLLLVEHINGMLVARNTLMKLGLDYYAANGIMSVQRVFHRSRLRGFKVVELADVRAELAEQVKDEPAEPDHFGSAGA
jgi:Holliday junction resolvase RusA-like endonuclease